MGGFEPGFLMDAVIFDAMDYKEIPYRFGTNLVSAVIKRGKLVIEKN